jgi:hypothetical protein
LDISSSFGRSESTVKLRRKGGGGGAAAGFEKINKVKKNFTAI